MDIAKTMHLTMLATVRFVTVMVLIYSISSVSGNSEVLGDGATLQAQCPPGLVLVFDQAQYGRTNIRTYGSRSFSTRNTKCSLAGTVSVLNARCFGKSVCQMPISAASFGADPCPGTSKYLTVTWQCVPASVFIDVCSAQGNTVSSGYLTSPNYPQTFTQNLNCILNVPQKPGCITEITLLDIEMEARPTIGCYDWLTLTDNQNVVNTVDFCGGLQTIKEKLVQKFKQLSVRFKTDSMNNFRGFLMKFEAVPENGRPEQNDHAWGMPQQGGRGIPAPGGAIVAGGGGGVENIQQYNQPAEERLDPEGEGLDSAEQKILKLKQALEDLEQKQRKAAERKRQQEEERRRKAEEEEKRRMAIIAQEQQRKAEEEKQRRVEEAAQKKQDQARLMEQVREEAMLKQERMEAEFDKDAVMYKNEAPAQAHPLQQRRNAPGQGCTRDSVPVPSHGYIVSLKEGKRVSLGCIPGYTIDDEDNGLLVCHGAAWMGEPGLCMPIECGAPEVPEHGEVIYRDMSVGSDAEYVCHRAYTLLGNTQRRCLEKGVWSGVVPVCHVPTGRTLSLFGEALLAVIVTIVLLFIRRKFARIFGACAYFTKRANGKEVSLRY